MFPKHLSADHSHFSASLSEPIKTILNVIVLNSIMKRIRIDWVKGSI